MIFLVTTITTTVNSVYADEEYVTDAANCPDQTVVKNSQNCPTDEVWCGYNGSALFCMESDLFAAAPSSTVTSTDNVASNIDGGYVINCLSDDIANDACVNSGAYECDRKESTYLLNRDTVCTADAFGASTDGDCSTGYYDCYGGDELCESTPTRDCDGSNNNHYDIASCSTAPGSDPSNAVCVCNSDAFACDGSETDTDGCENIINDVCGNNTGKKDSLKVCVNGAANCLADGTLDCDNDDGDSVETTCNGSNGCEIEIGGACITANDVPGTFAGTCGSGILGQCIATASSFETGTETGFSSENPLLWGFQYGVGALMSFASSISSFFVVDNVGNVGIGMDSPTSIPSSALHVNSTDANEIAIITIENEFGDIQLFRTDATPESSVAGSIGDIAVDSTNGKIYIKESGDDTDEGWVEVGAAGSSLVNVDSTTTVQVTGEDTITFDTDGIQRVIIDKSGFVGIGMYGSTSIPSSALHVNSTDANDVAIITIENEFGDIQLFRTDATPETTVDGSIGDIAVDSTNGKIYIKESGDDTDEGWVEVGAAGSSLVNDDSTTTVQVTGEDTITFDTNGIQRVIIDKSGFVGIGMYGSTAIPSSALHVNSTDANDVAIITLDNKFGDIQLFRTDESPETTVAGSIGDIAVDSTNGKIYIKESGNSDVTGWIQIGTSSFFHNKTTATYTGNLSSNGFTGYLAGNNICNLEFSGTHICTQSELMSTLSQSGITDLPQWSGDAWIATGGAKFVSSGEPANDCNGFTYGTSDKYFGNYWKFSQTDGGGVGAVGHCANQLELACCKP